MQISGGGGGDDNSKYRVWQQYDKTCISMSNTGKRIVRKEMR
jgi:hypothetical protein